jgi:hypothetical protein
MMVKNAVRKMPTAKAPQMPKNAFERIVEPQSIEKSRWSPYYDGSADM